MPEPIELFDVTPRGVFSIPLGQVDAPSST